MKSTMKSAFAFIAVALMIMVAVVPMVGVFTEDSSATTTVDPATDTDVISLDVNVYNESNVGVSAKVKIAYGAYAFYADANASGFATFSIREATVASLRISCVDADEVEIDKYPAVTLTNLVAGKTYKAELKAGYISQKVIFKFNNDSPIKDHLTTGSVITASYSVYKTNAADAVAISMGQFTINPDYTGTFQVPVGTTGPVFVAVTSFSSPIGVTFDANAKQSVTIGVTDGVLKAQQNLITINPGTNVLGVVTVTELKATYVDGTETKNVAFTPVKNTMVYATPVDAAYFIGILPTTGTLTYTADLSADNSAVTDNGLSATGSILTYDPTNAFFGKIAMGSTYVQGGTLSANIKDSSTPPNVVGKVSATVDAKGNFFKFVTLSATGTAIADISFVSNGTTFAPTTSSTYAGNAPLAFAVPNTGYASVTGTLGLDGTTEKIVGKELTITGAKTFGSLVTTTGGSFTFMAEAGKNIIISAVNSELYGDISLVPGATSTAKAITMKSQDLTLKVADARGGAITSGLTVKLTDGTTDISLVYNGTDEVYKASVRGDLTFTNYAVVITSTAGYTFSEKPAFVEGSTYNAYETKYTVAFYGKDGKTPITSTAGTDYNVYVATAYKNTLGSIVYDYGAALIQTSGEYLTKASLLNVKESDIGTTPVNVLLLVKETSLDNKGIFKPTYVLNAADEKGVISITASADSFTGKLVRNDGVTPVSGISVKLNNGTEDVAGATTYTQTDGSFTLYSGLTIGESFKVIFTATAEQGYEFNASDAVFKDSVKNTVFKAKLSPYTISFVDADDAKIDLTGMSSITVGDTPATVSGKVATLKASWDSKTDALAITGVTDRSFIDHALTAEELASGEITIKSNQKTYTFTVKDANGVAPIGITTINYYKYVGDIPTAKTLVPSTKKILLPVAGDDLDTVYGYKVTNDKDYAFETAVTKITDVKIDIKSTSAMKTVTLQDAAGVALTKDVTNGVTIKADGVALPAPVSIAKGSFKFVATKDVKYTYIIMGTSPYSFTETGVSDVNGVVKAKEETIYGKVTDAAGKYFSIPVSGVKAYDAKDNLIGTEGTQGANNTSFSIIAEKSKIAYYKVEDVTVSGDVKFTFEKSKTADIKAVETFVPITFESANGNNVTIEPSGYAVNVINKLGIQTAMTNVTVNDVNGIVLDTTNVVSYSITFGTSTAGYFEGTYTSTNGAFVSEYAGYEGKLGTTYATGDDLEYAVYKGNELVFREKISVTDGNTIYNAKVNKALGDKVIITLKKVVSGGATDIYTAVMNDNVVYNDLVKVVVAPSLKANIMVNNDYVGYELSADKTKVYLIANESYSVDATSSTGDVLVEKFVFDGWYVNGEKVSSKLNYTVDNVDSNVVMANYVSDGYYEVDKPVQNDNGVSPTVLAIGIAAVIVALIAVVYTVIQKKE
ncbi:hypothetical protein [Candidatus Methanarcanum hacksteinii]|uniref:hypothetical protein n=1 Tax=Candidatus Methanarcanum hacksteinii TaxID=2911857 RepID=UPI0037DC3D93